MLSLPIQSRRMRSLLSVVPKQNFNPPNPNMKHFKSVEFLSNFRMSSSPETNVSPPIEDFLVIVLYQYLAKCDNPRWIRN